jgi:hypothetical protein
MPTPEGVISTSTGPVEPEVELAEALSAVEDDKRLVEIIEKELPEAEE